jgi:glutamyl/glutaminyl-tRNA synthetase
MKLDRPQKKIMTENKKIVVRIPPSPTGYFHVGRARTALFNYLYAKNQGGEIVFRLEDTDKERSKKEYEEDIVDALAWLGITYDKGPFRQSERNAIYRTYIEKMLEKGTAYISKETEGKNTEVIRLKNPNKVITFNDLIRGEISFDTTELGDLVIARNIDDPLYHLTVVVDDFEMGITHVIRGDDGISNTPRQILIQEAIGAPRPIYAHVPLILGQDRAKMSARHGATSLRDFKAMGYLPESMVNYLALLGWNPGTDQEIFTLSELIEIFDLEKIQKGGAIFDIKKLEWVNKEHIKRLPEEERLRIIAKDFDMSEPVLDKEKIAWKTSNLEEAKIHLEHILPLLDKPDEIMKYAEEKGKGNVLWPIRYALSGKDKSPDPFTLLKIFGPDVAKTRIQKAIDLIS